MNCGVALLAAGESRRMGQPKLLLPWGATSILDHQLRLWRRLNTHQTAVVCAQGNPDLRVELDRVHFPADQRIVNPQPQAGMFSSIRCAAQWKGWSAALTHWVITLGDQPHLKQATLQTLLNFSATHPDKVCQPRRLARRHHPVILPRNFFEQLPSTPARTLRDFLNGISGDVEGCELEDPGLGFDIDTPADYERARSEFLGDPDSGDEMSAPPAL